MMQDPITTRNPLELQRAHDLLCNLVLDRRILKHLSAACRTPELPAYMTVALNCLCWCLNHEGDTESSFAEFLTGIEQALEVLGVQLVDSGRLHHRHPHKGSKPQ
jgi:hypothetical protein